MTGFLSLRGRDKLNPRGALTALSVPQGRRLGALGGLQDCTEHSRAAIHLSVICYDQTGPVPRHTYHMEMSAVGAWALTGIVPVLPPQFMVLVLSIKPKAEVIGYPSSHNPEAGKDSNATAAKAGTLLTSLRPSRSWSDIYFLHHHCSGVKLNR